MTYQLGTHGGQPYIRCMVCGTRSFHPTDIKERYCARCKRFHNG